MNQLPKDLRNLILLYLPYNDLMGWESDKNFISQYCEFNFLLNHKTIDKLWKDKDNYIYILSKINLVVPGSERFLEPQKCYYLAIRSRDFPTARYFGSKLGYKKGTIEIDFYDHLSKLGKFLINPYSKFSGVGQFRKILRGVVPQLHTETDLFDLLVLTIMHKPDLVSAFTKKYEIDPYTIQRAQFIAQVILKDPNLEVTPCIKNNFNQIITYLNKTIPMIDPQICQLMAKQGLSASGLIKILKDQLE